MSIPFNLEQADYYILADINIQTGRTTFEQVQIMDTPVGIMAECCVGFIPNYET